MHIFTHLKEASQGKTGLGIFADGMVEHDGHVGELLGLIDELGVTDNTIVVYTTDNGAECFTWPDGGSTPFRGEKATNWEGAFRVPCAIRWPGVIKAGTVVNDICAHEDFIPTFAAASGEPDLVAKLKKGHTLNGKKFKVHLDGENLFPFLSGKERASPREGFIYWSDDGDLMALRVRNWKMSFMIQEHHGIDVWKREFTRLRVPYMTNIRADPFERSLESSLFPDWEMHRAFLLVPAPVVIAGYMESFKEFQPRAKAASFTVSDVMEKIVTAGPNQN